MFDCILGVAYNTKLLKYFLALHPFGFINLYKKRKRKNSYCTVDITYDTDWLGAQYFLKKNCFLISTTHSLIIHSFILLIILMYFIEL